MEVYLNDKAADNIYEILKCTVCFEYMKSPIYQCHNGHTVCSSCKAKIVSIGSSCPTCRHECQCDIRCRALEKMAEVFLVNCKYKECGCTDLIPNYQCTNSPATHEDSCKFRAPYPCPCYESGESCPVVGDIPFLFSHLSRSHLVLFSGAPDFQHLFRFQDYTYQYDKYASVGIIIRCFDKYFCLHGEVYFVGKTTPTPVFMAFLSMMGEEEEVGEYRYSLVIGGSKAGRTTFTGIPRSLRDVEKKINSTGPNEIITHLPHGDPDREMTEVKVTGQVWKHSKKSGNAIIRRRPS